MHRTELPHVSSERFAQAPDFAAYAESAQKNGELWRGLYRTASVPESLLLRASALTRKWHLLAVSEDWCGDAVNTLPLLARFTDMLPVIELRLVRRETNPDLMAGHLTSGTRSIPVVIALDEAFVEHGWWGPRPTELQRWVRREGQLLPKEERYRRIRRWYARDRGRTTIEEVLEVLERAERHLGTGGPAPPGNRHETSG